MAAPTSDAFRRWFRASKIAHPDGTPLVVYHGGFDVLNSRAGTFRRSVGGELGTGIYFTPSRAVADYYAGSRGGYETTGGGALTEVYLSIQNPLVVSHESGRDPAIEALVLLGEPRARAETKVERVRERTGEVGKIIENAAVKADHDGILHYVDGDLYEIVAFQPGQVKSATQNAGTYEFFDPDIRRNPTRYNPAETFGPKKPLVGLYTYRVKQNSNGDTLLAVYHGSKRIAHIDAFWAYSMRGIEKHEEDEAKRGKGKRLVCATDLRSLGAEGKNPNVLSVSHAFIDDPDYKGKGIGRAMYQAMMVEGFAVRESRIGGSRGPMFFIPDECKGAGNTSADAQRVWASLAREYPSAGTSIRVDAPPVIGSRPAPAAVASPPPPKERPMNAYNALHAAAGDALQAWMNTHRDEVERRMRAPAAVREYRYGVRNRPPGYATVPSGYIRIEDAVPDETRTRHGVVVYDRPLTDEEVQGYELHPYMPLAEVVGHLLTRYKRYGEKLADNVRKSGDRMIRGSVSSELDRLPVYTDIPLGEVYTHVAQALLRQFPAPEPAPAAVREYRYGVRNRPPGYATVPSGLVRVEPPPFPQEARVRHGVVVYNRPLTDEEVRGYELHPYMPLAEVVDGVIASLGEYAEEAYAPNVREESAEQVRSETGGYLNDHTVYTDIPLAEVYKHVAAELLRRFPA